ncbi:MAG: VWA domain-containing protein [Victivallales bacterium]|nr:VWA domain-containing protein [Victivallales bacterium]
MKLVTWGYRDIFKRAIDDLFAEGLLRDGEDQSTELFFEILKKQSDDHPCHDHVLNSFLGSLNSEGHWIMRIPVLFSDWTSLGSEFARHKSYMGLVYFKLWGDGGFGSTPEDVSYVLDKARALKTIDIEFAYNFIASYKLLSSKLSNREIDVFMESAIKIFEKNRKNAYAFMRLDTKTAGLIAERISVDIRLEDVKQRLVKYASAISGRDVEIMNLGDLDSDELIERGCMMVAVNDCFFLPAKSVGASTKNGNMDFYMTACVAATSCFCFESFSTIHGRNHASTSEEFIASRGFANPRLANNGFIVCETIRVLTRMSRMFPGSAARLSRVSREEFRWRSISTPADEVMVEGLMRISESRRRAVRREVDSVLDWMEEVAICSVSFLDTIDAVSKKLEETLWMADFFQSPSAPLSFFPDFMFPSSISASPTEALALDLGSEESKRKNKDNEPDDSANLAKRKESPLASERGGDESSDDRKECVRAGFFYDEWNHHANDYFQNWCCLREFKVEPKCEIGPKPEYATLSKAVKRVFEKLKPADAKKEKRLPEGDNINIDLLTNFLSARKTGTFEKERFYEKPLIRKRDLTVAILLDMSGSTGEGAADGRKVIDLERDSAYILAEGLAEIGDRFGIFGFTGSGRENVEFFIFKEIDEEWDIQAKKALFSARPGKSTRIGVAIRHAGRKLREIRSKKKLILVVTDGKPMDAEYDHKSGYAQYDIRKANLENAADGIDSFCISTEENSLRDLELMFPNHRFLIVNNLNDLPRTLSSVYLKLT